MRMNRVVAVSAIVVIAAMGLLAGCKSGGEKDAAVTTAAAKNPMEMLPEDVNVVMHLDMAGFTGSELYRAVEDRFGDKMLPKTPEYADFLEATGFDVQRDLRTVTLGAVATLGGDADSVFIVVDGDFDRKKMESHLAEKPGVTQGTLAGLTTFEMSESSPEAGPPPTLAWLDERTMIVATAPDFQKFVDTIQGKHDNASGSNLAGMVSDQTGQMYAAMLVPHEEAGVSDPAEAGMIGALQQQLQTLETMMFSVEAGSGLDVLIHAQADSPESAQALFEMFNGYLSMGKMMAAQNPEVADILNRLKLVQVSSDIKLTLSITNAEFMAALESAQPTSTAQAIGG